MEDYEKLGLFYIGREYDLAARKPKENLVLYDSRDMVTHGICVGMTGSGKTGLCIAILEEAAIDGIPAIIIDPKGDMSNLLLTFPQLRPDDFAVWLNEDDARRKNLTPQEFASKQADLWKNGLASWQQSGERIARLKEAADFVVYTPGSTAGIPVSILKSFAAPPPSFLEDHELLRDRIMSTATSLLGLLGKEADPIKSKEHILISTILDNAWKQGIDMDLATLIQQIQTPPVNKIGVMNIDSFFPAKDRFELALTLNNLLAAPGFSTWMEGEALDIGQILYSPTGKPRHAIFSISHLSDSERMFFVSLLLNQVLAWMRQQPGTNSLRAMIYMDEIFGYFPPVANPPSKQPLLTLLKQARAYGIGILLATQNPVDLDYKGLSNTGTWLIGRLQTERDKNRLLEGLEGASTAQSTKFDRQSMEQILAGLGNRVFLMNNVHDDTPVILESRWAMSYLRGPLTRTQIKALMNPIKKLLSLQPAAGQSAAAQQPRTYQISPSEHTISTSPASGERPVLPPGIQQFFVPPRGNQSNNSLYYKPVVFGSAQVRFEDAKSGVDTADDITAYTEITDDPVPVNWDNARDADFIMSDFEKDARGHSIFGALPSIAGKAKSYDLWNKAFATWIYGTRKCELFKSPTYKQFSRAGESERDFRIRLSQSVREQRDEMAEKLRQKYQAKIASLDERIRKARQAVDREAEQQKQQQMQTAISVGATLLGAFLGRKAVSTGTVGRASTAARSAGRILKEKQDVERARDTVAAHQQRLAELEKEFQQETAELEAKSDPNLEELLKISIRPAKKDISVSLVGLVWLPYRQTPDGNITPAWA